VKWSGASAGTFALILLALLAFASNSLLTRLALGSNRIDAATFTAVRLVSGALMLAVLVQARKSNRGSLPGAGVIGALALVAYAAPFSFAYLRIGAAVGALVLFGVVQLTMIAYGLYCGERLSLPAWIGLVLAVVGLLALTLPSVSRPDPLGVGLMATAGVAWGVYSLAGRTAADPVAANARSFMFASVPAVALAVVLRDGAVVSTGGIVLATLSGAVTSGLGYAVWYRALPRLSVMQAAVAQLSVPVIAALGAVAFLEERLTARLLFCGIAVLGGVGIVLNARSGKRV
jgi:drug/metabolite transporter (DMT)-like permease